jgi:hypothetical protein
MLPCCSQDECCEKILEGRWWIAQNLQGAAQWLCLLYSYLANITTSGREDLDSPPLEPAQGALVQVQSAPDTAAQVATRGEHDIRLGGGEA